MRQALAAILGSALLAASVAVHAQAYPSKPVKIDVPFAVV